MGLSPDLNCRDKQDVPRKKTQHNGFVSDGHCLAVARLENWAAFVGHGF
jgi:hypothetical protein